MSKLRETLEAGAFPVVVELKPPKGTGVDEMLAVVKALAGRVTAFSLPDNEHAKMRLSAVAAARLVQEAGGEALVHFTCRDRNRLALESDLLGAASLGLEQPPAGERRLRHPGGPPPGQAGVRRRLGAAAANRRRAHGRP